MQFETWQELFYNRGEGRPMVKHDDLDGLVAPLPCTLEELYQHFKARLMDEVVEKKCYYYRNISTQG